MAIIQKIDTDYVTIHHTKDSLQQPSYNLHCHNYYELFYFVQGEAGYRVEGTYYQPAPHSLLLIPPRTFHGIQIEAGQTYERYALHFLPDMICLDRQGFLLDSFKGNSIYYEKSNYYKIQELFDFVLNTPPILSPIQEEILYCRIQALLSQVYQMTHTVPPEILPQGQPADELIRSIIHYVNAHLTETLTLEELAAKFFISKNHLNRTFRAATGTTVGNYITHKRAALAQDLMDSGVAATTASLEAGFRDYSNFFRTYKQIFGHSPAQDYRKRSI